MIKLVYCIRKRSDISAEEFYTYWRNNHGPLVKKYASAINAVKYVQSHTTAPELNQSFVDSLGLKPPYEGITEVWWNSLEDMMAGYATEQGQEAGRALSEDEAKFIDHTASSIFMTEEHEIF